MNEKQKEKKTVRKRYSLIEQIRTNKKAYYVYITLLVLTGIFVARSVMNGQWESVFVGFLTFMLYFIPPFVEKAAKVELPTTLEILAFVFVFCAQVLGELENFYVRFPLWDSLLHAVCGFMFAAFGFCLIDILNQGKVNKFAMSPIFMAFLAFCFSMTIGVVWEFIEFGIDNLFLVDMQKDFLINDIYSVTFDSTLSNKVVGVKDIVTTVITTENGEVITLNGYLDVGLFDTMKDLLVNFVGAVVFSIIGFFYVKKRGKGKFAKQFIPRFAHDEEESCAVRSEESTTKEPKEEAAEALSEDPSAV